MAQPPGQPQPQPFPAAPPAQGNTPAPVTIDAVVQLLRDDKMRGFRINVETDSLVESDQKQERADATELVSAIGTFFKEFGPIVQAMPPLAPMASGLLQFAVRRYKVGAELEELIEKCMGDVQQHLANPAPQAIPPVEQAKLAQVQAKGQIEGQKGQVELAATQTRAKAETDKAQLEMFQSKVQHETTLQLAHEQAQRDKEAKILDAEIKTRADQRAHELHALKIQQERESHAHKLQTADQQHQQTLQKGEQDMTAAKESHQQQQEKQ